MPPAALRWAALLPFLVLGCTRHTLDLPPDWPTASRTRVADAPAPRTARTAGAEAASWEIDHGPAASHPRRTVLLSTGPEAPQPAPEEPADEVLTPPADPPDDPLQATLALTGVYQLAVGGAGPDAARPTVDYDLNLARGLWRGGRTGLRLQGGCGAGIDPLLAATAPLNEHAPGDSPLAVSELWIEQALEDGQIHLTFGKLDLRHYFDGLEPAVAEGRDFLASALGDDPSIPWPANGFAVRLELARWGWPYYAIGAANALARPATFGMDELDRERVLYLHELGVRTKVGRLTGNWRGYFWQRTDTTAQPGTGRPVGGRRGFGAGFNQELTRRLELFGRFGFAGGRSEAIRSHGSLGLLVHEPIPGRSDDAVGLAVARNERSHRVGPDAGTETLVEAFYRARLGEHFELTFDAQWLGDPGGAAGAADVGILGVRGRLRF